MSEISTKELFDEFYSTQSESKAKKVRPQVDRPEVYAYEKKIGKQLVEMNVDELFEMLLTFNNNSSKASGYFINYNSFNQIASEYRNIFNHYINNHKVIINPWYDSRMRGVRATERLAKDKPAFTWKIVEETIANIRSEYEEPRANYFESIIMLFYCGFSKAEEIVRLKEADIDFKNKLVRLPGRTIHMNNRCAELLQYVHRMDAIESDHGHYKCIPYQDGYFKFIVRPRYEASFNTRPILEVSNFLNRMIVERVKKRFEVDINPRMLYMLGFYDSLVERYGAKRVQELILSVRNSKDATDLLNHAIYYGINVDNPSVLKRMLRPFLDLSESDDE